MLLVLLWTCGRSGLLDFLQLSWNSERGSLTQTPSTATTNYLLLCCSLAGTLK
jgi:hypothetical protein